MKNKISKYIVCVMIVPLFLLFSCDSNKRISLRTVKIDDLSLTKVQYEIARRYILCTCIEKGRKMDTHSEPDHTLSLYADMGKIIGYRSLQLDSLVNSVLKGITFDPKSQVGGKTIMDDCIEYYDSKKINRDIAAAYKIASAKEDSVVRMSGHR
ncbi:hypothetical protein SAMN05216436_1562 [bacterium A37T11]|nr:hypothetical protein SAMN05216436_1562 [bacterium A37T11]